MNENEEKRISLGPATAYADAVKGGYTGTREQFRRDMARLAQNVTEVRENREAAETAQSLAESAKEAAEAAAEEAKKAGGTAVGAVLYTEQSLSEEQQEKARSNIGAISADDLDEITATDEEFEEMLNEVFADDESD